MAENNYVTINDVADYYMVSVSTVRGWVRDNKIPHLQVGKTYRFRLAEIDASLRKPEPAPVDDTPAIITNPDQDI